MSSLLFSLILNDSTYISSIPYLFQLKIGAVHKRDLAEIISVESQLELQPEGECPYVTNWPLKLLFKSNRDDPSNIYCAPNGKLTASDLSQYYKNDFTVRIGGKTKINNPNLSMTRYGDDNENNKTPYNTEMVAIHRPPKNTAFKTNEFNTTQEYSEYNVVKNEEKTRIKSELKIVSNERDERGGGGGGGERIRGGSRRGGGERGEREKERERERVSERERERGSERGGGMVKKKIEANYVSHRRRGGSSRNRRTENIPERRAEIIPERRMENIPERRAENIPERRTENIPERRAENIPEIADRFLESNNDEIKKRLRQQYDTLPTAYIALID